MPWKTASGLYCLPGRRLSLLPGRPDGGSMGALIFIVASALLLLLGPLLGFLLLALRRTRRTAAFFLFLPTSATGGAIFGFWLLERLLHARISPQQALEASFYLGYVPF